MKFLLLTFTFPFYITVGLAQIICATPIDMYTESATIEKTQEEIDQLICARVPSPQDSEQAAYAQTIQAQSQNSSALISRINPDLDQTAKIFDGQNHLIYESPESSVIPKNLEELRNSNINNQVSFDHMSQPLPKEMMPQGSYLNLQQFEQIRNEMFRIANPSRFTPKESMSEEEKSRLPLEDGCFLRASMVSEYLANNYPQLPVLKAWLLTDKSFEFYEDKGWRYHVSPFIPVQVGREIKWIAMDTITLGQPAMDLNAWTDFVVFKDKDDKRRTSPLNVELTYSDRVTPSKCILNLENIHETEFWEPLNAASKKYTRRANPFNFNNGKTEKKGLFKGLFKKKNK